MMCVIGSGPAGVSAAYALLKAGHKVLMLDVGRTLEPDIQTVVARMSDTDKSAWLPSDLSQLRNRTKATSGGVPVKYAYGSDFPYHGAKAGIQLIRRNADLLPSFARGGLSTVWGAALLPYCGNDMKDWPISPGDLAPYYSALHEFLPIAGTRDGLEQVFPLYGNPAELGISRQTVRLMQDLCRRPIPGLRFGQSRLAVKHGCTSCGMCLYGCPYGLIYTSADTLSYLRTFPDFTYQADTVVHRLEESKGAVVIDAEHAGNAVTLRADAVFLAAGTLSSTRIILESLAAFERPLPMRHSQHFLFPLLRQQRTIGVSKEELHTLSQAFLEISDSELSPYTIHLQCYTYNDLFPEAIRHALGRPATMLPLEHLYDRLILVQGYLHSDHSAPMQLTLKRDRLYLEGPRDSGVHTIVTGIMKKLRPLGLAIAPDIGIAGRGFHAGGTLPMRRSPASFETDTEGRPHGMERIHVVDASIFPSIPSTTITYTAMANAYRIGAQYTRMSRSSGRAMRCAITGANGYVGSALANYLRQQGFEVIPLVRKPLGPGRAYSLEDPVPPDTLRGVDFLVHAAYDFSIQDAERLRQVNIEGSRRLFAAAREANVRHSVLISSLSAYSGCPSNYGRTKMAIEEIARMHGASIVRPGLVFGQQPGGILGALKRISRSPIIPLVNTGEQLLYMTHQEDLGRLVAHLLSMTERNTAAPIPAAHPAPMTIKDIIGSFTSSTKVFLPLPAKAILLGLRIVEAAGFSSRLRSDGLVNLLATAPPPDFTLLETSRVTFRPYQL